MNNFERLLVLAIVAPCLAFCAWVTWRTWKLGMPIFRESKAILWILERHREDLQRKEIQRFLDSGKADDLFKPTPTTAQPDSRVRQE